MRTFGLLFFLILGGPGFLWLGIRSLRTGAWHDGVPALELMMDRMAGEEPPPRTAWDRRFAFFHAWMLALFGTFFSLVGLAVLIR